MREQMTAFVQMATDHDVFGRTHAEEYLQILKRAREAAPREVIRRLAGNILPPSRTRPRLDL